MKRNVPQSLLHLQDYGSSESEEEVSVEKNFKRLPVPQLPTYHVSKSIIREPKIKEKDQLKIRNFPHEPGNWATYIYVPLETSNCLHELIDNLLDLLLPIKLYSVEDFHISVTKTVVLRHHWIKDFINSTLEVLADVQSFFINLSGLSVYLNEKKTRTFIGLQVREGSEKLNEIVKMLNKCLSEYNLPPFYDSPSFHLSVLWCVGDKSDEIKSYLNNLPEIIENFNILNHVIGLKCNSGNKTFNLSFQNKSKIY